MEPKTNNSETLSWFPGGFFYRSLFLEMEDLCFTPSVLCVPAPLWKRCNNRLLKTRQVARRTQSSEACQYTGYLCFRVASGVSLFVLPSVVLHMLYSKPVLWVSSESWCLPPQWASLPAYSRLVKFESGHSSILTHWWSYCSTTLSGIRFGCQPSAVFCILIVSRP